MNPDRRNALEWGCALLVAVALVALAQGRMHAWQASYGAYPDESSHYVAGLLVRDYLAGGWPSSPLQFAKNFYLYQPYLAIGYWPPAFYVIEGIWMTLFGHLRGSVMIYVGVIAVLIALMLFAVVRKRAGFAWALLASAAFLLLPTVQWSSSIIMTDLAVTLTCLATTLALGRYFSTPDWRWALIAGALASLAMLTKYLSAYALIAPVVLLAIDRRWDLLAKKQTWIMPLTVILCCGPWMWWSRGFLSVGFRGFDAGTLSHRIQLLAGAVRLDLGLLLGAIAAASSLWAYFRWRTLSPSERLLSIQFPCLAAFLVLGGTGIEARYLLPAYPGLLAMISFAAAASGKRGVTAAIFAAVLVVFGFTHKNPYSVPSGLVRQAAQDLLAQSAEDHSAIVVPTRMEGAFIAELSSAEPVRSRRVLARPSKLFSRMTWLGGEYQLLTPNLDAMKALFDEYPLDTVVLMRPEGPVLPHDQLLREMVDRDNVRWKLTRTYCDAQGEFLKVYARRGDSAISTSDALVKFLQTRLP